ncbi:hypothetical protein PL11201_490075 [Planktothrix sp. PCC 11201]|uniref:hypothetical protein n=1 Tax=Planktothrix sp. PCC 11201 TaxID=1729650 RepID=UPI0009185FF1|nr:hypothetical protein [Planktothrix sp. PCC 11201]SKB11193.1 hypothetical protein PL11201_110011 [Planktothrix sp. PCC 11201]SKB13331.1 hypothetical protein PL11201_490066 [Planktothrix sp. PCC 11201]SKB13340.1 hypothetical protein PL11201_490075 [Planktothrix sp. PCC 11201]
MKFDINGNEGSYQFWDRFNNEYLVPLLHELAEALETSDISSSSKIRWYVLHKLLTIIIEDTVNHEYYSDNAHYREINEIL